MQPFNWDSVKAWNDKLRGAATVIRLKDMIARVLSSFDFLSSSGTNEVIIALWKDLNNKNIAHGTKHKTPLIDSICDNVLKNMRS